MRAELPDCCPARAKLAVYCRVRALRVYISRYPLRGREPGDGLFCGAYATILARLVPYLTPELAAYLNYLWKLGDLMVHYTTRFLLDH
jgi:hypothetical protein